MASNTMLEVMARKKQKLAELEELKSTEDTQEQPQDIEPDPEPISDDEDEVLEAKDDDDVESNEVEETPNQKDSANEPDYKNKFERLRTKQSKIEKQDAEKDKQIQLLELQLQQAKTQALQEPDKPDTPKETQAVTTEEVESYLSETLGDDYEFMDESNKRAYTLLAKETISLRKQPKGKDVNVEEIVNKRLKEEQERKQAESYSKELDKFVKEIDPDADFIEMVNEPAFDDFIKNNRVARAMFVEASNSFDDESKQIMRDVVSAYLGKDALKPLAKKNTAPNVTTKSTPEPKRKKRKISQKKYEEAKLTFKRRPSQRRDALKVIQAYEEQEAEG